MSTTAGHQCGAFYGVASAAPKLVAHSSATVTFGAIGWGDWLMYLTGVYVCPRTLMAWLAEEHVPNKAILARLERRTPSTG